MYKNNFQPDFTFVILLDYFIILLDTQNILIIKILTIKTSRIYVFNKIFFDFISYFSIISEIFIRIILYHSYF